MAATDLDKQCFVVRSDDLGLLTLVSPTTQVGANTTTGATAVAIGFTFTFDGVAYTTIDELSTYGVCCLNNTPPIPSAPGNLFAAATTVLLAPWYTNSRTAITTGYIKTEVQGTAPFRRLVIEWKVYGEESDPATDCDVLNYQLVLYESVERVEFRYAARVTVGTPSAIGAARGVKGETIGLATNFRDLAVFNLALGGSDSTTTATLDVDDYDALVAGGAVVMEPNWPMAGRAFLIDPNEVTGFDPYSVGVWKMAQFVNWLWCNHTPALLNFSPYQGAAVASAVFVRPCVPSDEGLDYKVWVQVYAGSGGNCTVTIDEDAAADPQPATGADWSNIGSDEQAVVGGSWNGLTPVTVTIDPGTTYLRFTVALSAGTGYTGSILVAPAALDDLDEVYTSLTGFIPMGLMQLRQTGAAVHAEWFNRAYRNMALILADRRQEVWSSVYAVATLASATNRPVRAIGVSKGTLAGWAGQAAKARIYARDTTGGAPLQISEEGNGLLAEFTVDASGGEFRAQSADVDLLASEPDIRAICDPVGTLYPHSIAIDWAPTLSTANLIPGVTPSPRLAYLFAIAARMEKCLRCYAHAGLAVWLTRGASKGASAYNRVQTMVGPATKALRPKVARSSDDQHGADGWSYPTSIYAASSGSGPDNEIIIPSPHLRGGEDYPPEGAIAYAYGAEVYDAAPTDAIDRYLESPTATVMTGAAVERVEVAGGVGITFTAVKADGLAL